MSKAELSFDPAACSVARTLSVVGEKWTLLILRDAFYGVRRFGALQQRLGVARDVLSARLKALVEHGLLERAAYREADQRERWEYRLTAAGRDLFPVIVALLEWGDRHLAPAEGGPVALVHLDCGAPVELQLHCAAGHRLSGLREVRALRREEVREAG